MGRSCHTLGVPSETLPRSPFTLHGLGETLMARPRKLAPWMAAASILGFDPARILQKVRALRSREAAKFGIDIPRMEVVYGWNLDEMATSLLHAIEHERCRGPRCARIRFRDLVQNPTHLGLITGDIIDPETEPVFCMNFRWCCESDNKGDRDSTMRDRAARLVAQRSIIISPPNIEVITIEQGTLW